jgi:hypothetical protein
MSVFDNELTEQGQRRFYDGSTGESWACLNDDCPNCIDKDCSHHCHEFDVTESEHSATSELGQTP